MGFPEENEWADPLRFRSGSGTSSRAVAACHLLIEDMPALQSTFGRGCRSLPYTSTFGLREEDQGQVLRQLHHGIVDLGHLLYTSRPALIGDSTLLSNRVGRTAFV